MNIAFRALSTLLLISSTVTAQSKNAIEGSIQGRVFDVSGKPIQQALVTVRSTHPLPSAASIRYVESDDEGRFSFDRLIPDEYRVLGKKEDDGYPDLAFSLYSNNTGIPIAKITADRPVVQVDITIGPKAGALKGEIIDAGSGKPISAGVHLWRIERPDEWLDTALKSEYRVLIPPDVSVGITFSAEGYVSWTYSGALRLRSGETLTLPVVLQPAAAQQR